MKNNNLVFTVFPLIFLFVISCHTFSYEKKIADKYYLIGVDTKDNLTISRKLRNGDYIGRVPAKVLRYGIRDSFIIAESLHKGAIRYYIVNMQQDSEYAHENIFLIGPLTESEFNQEWRSRLNVNLKKPEL